MNYFPANNPGNEPSLGKPPPPGNGLGQINAASQVFLPLGIASLKLIRQGNSDWTPVSLILLKVLFEIIYNKRQNEFSVFKQKKSKRRKRNFKM